MSTRDENSGALIVKASPIEKRVLELSREIKDLQRKVESLERMLQEKENPRLNL